MPAHNKSLVSLQPLWGLVSSCPHFETWTRYCPQCFLGTRISPTKSILHHVWCLRICQSIIIRASEWNIHAALAISKVQTYKTINCIRVDDAQKQQHCPPIQALPACIGRLLSNHTIATPFPTHSNFKQKPQNSKRGKKEPIIYNNTSEIVIHASDYKTATIRKSKHL